ncbi:E1-E2 ATPase-domain-containing protein [Aspergillus pseudotamarii]|uniref:E1-E2 ATPase-domain-containing protein n=1 Tax=Aspergillus pseudotamarii TaxID=132259 RepID=A0A5N6STS6_ASPPS|nr:E1-E2 ATPase-domain-containing protein [Aspergillus pseudotamarii]KAE8137287.1 E1-E2 ATPase-domain-containing protein [Aspergillus pseudotamarii]
MVTDNQGSPPQSRLTTILVNNLHCPSCVTNVEDTLSALTPSPFSISTSIVSHAIRVTHPITLSSSRIVSALEDVAFEIDSVIANDSDGGDLEAQQHQPRHASSGKHDVLSQSKVHIQKCDECATQLAALSSSASDNERAMKEITAAAASVSSADNSLTSVVDDRLTGSRTRITLSISGMSCSSCVGKITGALQNRPWILSADVNLLTSSAVIMLMDNSHVDEVLEIIRSSGYTVELIDTEELQPQKPSKPSGMADAWRASYVIGGMTCSSCVGKVTDTLNHHDWITKVDVNLVSGSATVEFQGKTHLEEIAEIIKGLGYTATLSDLESRAPAEQRSAKRSLMIQRILDALEVYSARLDVTEPPSKAQHRLTVNYLPDAPNFTIRHIIRTIADVDKSFTVSIYHPPSLEERSQAMHRRHQWQIARRLALSVLAAIPTFIIGIVYMSLVSKDNPGRMYLEEPMWAGQVSRIEWALFIMATPVYFFAADLFHRRMITELKALWRPGSKTPILRRFYRFGSMDMLMSLGTSIAYFSSIAILAIDATQPRDGHKASRDGTFFDSVVFLTMFLMIGRLLEAYSKAKAGDAVGLLGKLRPKEALLVERDGEESTNTRAILADQLEFGDVVRVANGASPPYDGTVVEGESQFDESSLTGESRPVTKSIGDDVFSGTINQAGPVSVRITGLSGDSMLDQIIGAVREGQIRRAPIERTADLITGVFVPIITLIAILDWIVWLALGLSGRLPDSWMNGNPGGWEFWSLQFAISVFVVACPCGIGLAAPTALFVGGGLAAQNGILVKGGGEAFQEASQLDCIVFDKTGTITEGGEPAITDHEVANTEDVDNIWGAVLDLEQNSSHPIAKAMVSFANSQQPPALKATTVDEIPGKGMKGSFFPQGQNGPVLEVIIGNEALMKDYKVVISSSNDETLTTWKRQAKSVVLVGTRIRPTPGPTVHVPWKLSLMLAVADPVRPEAKDTLQALRNRGIAVWMLSGDNPTTAHAVGEMVGISADNIIAGVLPEQKAEKVQYLQKTLQKPPRSSWFKWSKEPQSSRAMVAMVGDGINDSPALTVADVGIAIGSGSDIAISSAEFVLVSSGLTSLLTLIDLSRLVFRRIKFNFGWALVYNCVAVPVAAGVFYPIVSNGTHVRLDPIWASLAMALSSVSVVCIGFRAKK